MKKLEKRIETIAHMNGKWISEDDFDETIIINKDRINPESEAFSVNGTSKFVNYPNVESCKFNFYWIDAMLYIFYKSKKWIVSFSENDDTFCIICPDPKDYETEKSSLSIRFKKG